MERAFHALSVRTGSFEKLRYLLKGRQIMKITTNNKRIGPAPFQYFDVLNQGTGAADRNFR
jgi:hypothetical protein